MKGADFLNDTKGFVILAGLVVAGYLVYRLAKVAPKIPTPGNATNADGTPQTAYQDTGPLGYVAAATNAASGGWLSTAGDWIGSKTYDLLNADPNATLTSANAATTGNNDAALALYQRPMDYGTPGTSPDGW
jgi:hypothetical protein